MRDEITDEQYTYYPHKRYISLQNLEDAQFALTNSVLKDIYDKHQILVSKQEFEQNGGLIPMSQRYFWALSVCLQFSFYFVLIFFMIDKHQVFAKQVTLTFLLIAMYVSVYMKMPKEGEKDNQFVDIILRYNLLSSFTYHEIFLMVQKLFSNLFHLILAVSRLVDVHPIEEIKVKMKQFQKIAARC